MIIPGLLRPGTLGYVATSTSLSQDVLGLSKDNSDLGYPGITQPWNSRISQPWDSRICDLHKLIPGCPGIIPACPGISKDNSDLGYPGITQPWDSRISQPWDSRICGYLHRLIPGQLRPRIFWDYPGITHPWDSRITQPWDSRICGYLHKHIPGCPRTLIPGCPGIIPRCPGIIPGQLGSVATSTSLSQDVPGRLSQDVPGYTRTTQTWDIPG